MLCSKKDEWKNSPNGGYWVGPSHTACTICFEPLRAGWPLFDGTKGGFKPPAKAAAAAASPSKRVTQPQGKAGQPQAKSKEFLAMEKKVAAMEKQLAAQATPADEDDGAADGDIADEAKTAEQLGAALHKLEARRTGYVHFLDSQGIKHEGDTQLEEYDAEILEAKRARDRARSPLDRGNFLHKKLSQLEKQQAKDTDIMRQALDDAAAAEERGAVAKARWDRRSDKITAFTLELTQLDYTSPAGGQGGGRRRAHPDHRSRRWTQELRQQLGLH